MFLIFLKFYCLFGALVHFGYNGDGVFEMGGKIITTIQLIFVVGILMIITLMMMILLLYDDYKENCI